MPLVARSIAIPVPRSRTCRRAVSLALAAAVSAPVVCVGGSGTAVAAVSPVRVNAGGGSTTAAGVTWEADRYFTGGTPSTSSNPIAGTSDDALFQRRRWGMTTYRIPVPAGTYRVRLLSAETYWTAAGKRVFSVTAEHSPFVTDVDLYKAVGANTAWSFAKDVAVSDGYLTLNFTAKADNAVVSAIEVTPSTPTLPPPPPPTTPPPTSGPVPIRSGLPWASGVYVPGSQRAKHEAFGAWRGRPLDVVVDWSARSSWNDVVSPGWLYDAWKGTPYVKVLGVAPFPENVGASLATCRTGAYNGYWKQFATNIKAAGLDDETIVRLGWEFNGNWYKWSAHNPADFAECWRQVVTSAESVAPALRWDWNVNRGPGQSVSDPRLAYPGDAYVDIVGVDSYDGWPGATSEATWQEHYAGAYGLKFWLDFAKAHGKRLSVPEWGVYPGTAWAGHNGGDNPFYIAKMNEFFRTNAAHIAYEAYFNEPASYCASSLYGPTQNPRAAAQYNAGW